MSDFSQARQNMVDCQVRTADVTDLRIIEAMLKVPRELFVPSGQRAMAYLDIDIAAGTPGRFLIKPFVLAKMLQAADITATSRVLVVGCVSGYSAAIAASLAGSVLATESDPTLARLATETLASLKLSNVAVSAAPNSEGSVGNAPYDAIILDGATEVVPENLYRLLAVGGRLVGVFAITRPARATIVTRTVGDFTSRPLFDASAPVLPGLERIPAFSF